MATIVTTDSIRRKRLRPQPIKRDRPVKGGVVIPINSLVGVVNGLAEPLDASTLTYDEVLVSVHRVDTTGKQDGEVRVAFQEGMEIEFDAASLADIEAGAEVYAETNVTVRADDNSGANIKCGRLADKTSNTKGFVRVGLNV